MLPIGKLISGTSPCLISGANWKAATSSDELAPTASLDVIIPVYNESANILPTLRALLLAVKTPLRVLICYDHDDDSTLTAITENRDALGALSIEFVRNRLRGAHGAVLTGFATSTAPFALVMMADDDYNAGIIDAMVAKAETGCKIVCASRFMPGGSMVGCPWLKAMLVRAGNFTLYHLARFADAGRHEWVPAVCAARARRNHDQVGPRLLLQHRVSGEMPSSGLAHRRGPGAVVRTRTGH